MAQAGGRRPDAAQPADPAAPSSAVRERLVAAAWQRFARYGLRETTAADIAATAGVDLAEFHAWFATPSDAMVAVSDTLGSTAGHLYATLEDLLTDPGDDRITAWLDAFVGWWVEHEAILRAVREAAVQDPRLVRHIMDGFDRFLIDQRRPPAHLTERQRADARQVLWMLVGHLDQLCVRWRAGELGRLDHDGFVRSEADVRTLALRPFMAPPP